MILLKQLMILLVLCLAEETRAFWWIFRSGDGQAEQPAESATKVNSLQNVFAPFEVSNTEEKFLTEASHYLGNLPKLDQCNLLIINRLRQSCNKMTEEDLSKLSVNLLNCQSLSEGRKTYKCTDDMTLTQCTTGMDSDTWNAYHIVSNRARSVCYNLRQTEFRMKTEITVNKLATSALDNLGILKQLMSGQDKLKEVTEETTTIIQEGQKDILENNKKLKNEQLVLQDSIADNIKRLHSEKVLMTSRHKQIENFSRLVNKQLDSLLKEFQHQGSLTKKGDKEILGNLEAVKKKSEVVLEKLESTLESMDNKYATIEQKHSDTIKSMEDIQKTITFMNDVMKKLESNINKQISWLNYFVGGTEDKLTVIAILLGHSLYFLVAVLAVLFVGGSMITKLTILTIFPMNAITAVRGAKHFKFEELGLIVLFTYPVSWLVMSLVRLLTKRSKGCETEKSSHTLSSLQSTLPLPGLQIKQEPNDFVDERSPKRYLPQFSQDTVRNEIHRLLPQLSTGNTEKTYSAPSTPRGRRQLLWSSTPAKDGLNDSSHSFPTTPASEGKGSRPRCSSRTAKGILCRNSALTGLDVCRVHSSKSSLPFMDLDAI